MAESEAVSLLSLIVLLDEFVERAEVLKPRVELVNAA